MPRPGRVAEVKDSLADVATIEVRAQRVVERLALVLQGSLLVRNGHPAVAVWDLASGRRSGTTHASADEGVMALSPGGRTLAASEFQGISFWRPATDSMSGALPLEGSPQDVAFSPDDREAAVFDIPDGGSMWSLRTRKKLWSTR